MTDKEIIATVTYSDETSDLLNISLVDYSEKSFAFAIELADGKTVRKLSKTEKEHYNDIKYHFAKRDEDVEEDDTPQSLNGKGNTGFSYADGSKFFGYIFSKSYGQDALSWFATRTSELPDREEFTDEILLENEINLDDQEAVDEFINLYSSKTEEELFEIMGMEKKKPKRRASKKQQSPKFTKNGPSKVSIPGLPTKKAVAKPKVITLKEALNVVFEAFKDGKIDELEEKYEYKATDDKEKYDIIGSMNIEDSVNLKGGGIRETLSFTIDTVHQQDSEDGEPGELVEEEEEELE